MTYPLSLQQKTALSLKQTQRLMMSKEMQQSLSLLQLPVLELALVIEEEMEHNPVLEYSEEDEEIQDTTLQEEVEEAPLDGDIGPAEHPLQIDDNDFEILQRLDEEFTEHFSQNGDFLSSNAQKEQGELHDFLESSITAQPSLFEGLMMQARDTFDSDKDFSVAREIIGNLDKRGLFPDPLEEVAHLNSTSEDHVKAILNKIQQFDPPGIAARSTQDSLLNQLLSIDKGDTLAYQILYYHFEDLIHNRLPAISKGLNQPIEAIKIAIDHDITHLSLHPGANFSQNIVQTITPDVTVCFDGENLKVEIDTDSIPDIRINTKYLQILKDENTPEETKDYIKEKLSSGKWLMRNIHQRNQTLYRIAESLSKRQHAFMSDPKGQLVPLTMGALAEELELHESTIARAVSSKYISCPRGVLPLRAFFTHGYENTGGADISSETVKELLKELLAAENKAKPYSDETISLMMNENGIPCARRTISKYRQELNIGNTSERREYR